MLVLAGAERADGDRLTGPQIRALELADALGRRHEVTVAGAQGARTAGAHRRVGAGRRSLVREAARHDVVLGAWIPPFLLALLPWLGTRGVADLYDPAEHELRTAAGPDRAARLRALRMLTELQLRMADVLLCAGERQAEVLRRRLAGVRSRADDVTVVAFGVPPGPTAGPGRLRSRLGLDSSDVVVVWWGSLWRWLDPETAIEAFARALAVVPALKLVFTAGPPPSSEARSFAAGERALELSRSLGLEEAVLFLEEWIPYPDRDRWLRDADLGICLHSNDAEAHVAARARYLDLLWCGVPSVLSRGDELAAAFEQADFARLVEPGNADEVAHALVELGASAAARNEASAAGAALADERRWPKVAEPLLAELERGRTPRPCPGWRRDLARVALYYARLLRDRLARSSH